MISVCRPVSPASASNSVPLVALRMRIIRQPRSAPWMPFISTQSLPRPMLSILHHPLWLLLTGSVLAWRLLGLVGTSALRQTVEDRVRIPRHALGRCQNGDGLRLIQQPLRQGTLEVIAVLDAYVAGRINEHVHE